MSYNCCNLIHWSQIAVNLIFFLCPEILTVIYLLRIAAINFSPHHASLTVVDENVENCSLILARKFVILAKGLNKLVWFLIHWMRVFGSANIWAGGQMFRFLHLWFTLSCSNVVRLGHCLGSLGSPGHITGLSHWLNFLSNHLRYSETGMHHVTCLIQEHQLRLYGHVVWFSELDPTYCILIEGPAGYWSTTCYMFTIDEEISCRDGDWLELCLMGCLRGPRNIPIYGECDGACIHIWPDLTLFSIFSVMIWKNRQNSEYTYKG